MTPTALHRFSAVALHGSRAVALCFLVVVAGACGSGSGSSLSLERDQTTTTDTSVAPTTTDTSVAPTTTDTSVETSFPLTIVDSTGFESTIESIDRIIPVDGDLAEIVFALGLGDNVVATDLSATYPEAAADRPNIGYQRALSAEPIAAFEPTIVLATDLAGPDETLDALRRLGIPVVVIEVDDGLMTPVRKIELVAEALGVPARGSELAASVADEIDSAVASAREPVGSTPSAEPVRAAVLYLRGDSTQLLLGEGSGIEPILTAIGVVDVARELQIVGHRQISAEALLLAAPDVFIVTTTGLESVGGIDGLLAIPGIAETPAGKRRAVLVYEDQFLLGGGPRTGQLVAALDVDLQSLFTPTN